MAADPALLETLEMDKLLPSSDDVPERFELGTLPYELMAEHHGFGRVPRGPCQRRLGRRARADRSDRRRRLVASLHALEEHEDRLGERLEAAIRAMPAVRVHSNAAVRTPTLLFTVDGKDPQEVRTALADKGINAPASNFYAIECSRALGLGDGGGGADRARPLHR